MTRKNKVVDPDILSGSLIHSEIKLVGNMTVAQKE
jgi:hypothetical protein